MISIHAAASDNDDINLPARNLFREYGRFLRATQACGTFNFPRFDEEIATLPAFYADHGGEVLVAFEDRIPAACIAYRAADPDPDHPNPNLLDTNHSTCLLKRLFVLPAFRGRGLARLLVAETLTRATARHYTRAILDTDTVNMPGALALYTSFGFRVYAPQQGDIAFLERALPWSQGQV